MLVIAADETLRRFTTKAHLSPLAVGLGIYLPTQSTLMVVVGAIVGWYFDRRAERASNPEATKQLGVLLASGMIVGEGLGWRDHRRLRRLLRQRFSVGRGWR